MVARADLWNEQAVQTVGADAHIGPRHRRDRCVCFSWPLWRRTLRGDEGIAPYAENW